MKVERKAELLPFEDLEFGRLLIGVLGDHPVLGIKAFSRSGGPPDDWFVRLGSNADKATDFPSAHHSYALKYPRVLDLSARCQFEPSIDLADILADVPHVDNCRGAVLLSKNETLLAVLYKDADLRRTLFLNLDTGELGAALHHTNVYLTRRWRVVEVINDERFVRLEYLYTHSKC